MSPDVSVVVEDAKWKKARLLPRLKRAASFAWTRAKHGKAPHQFSILLTDDAKLKELNAQFRGKNKSTNVLSFPASQDGPYLGDIAIAFGVTAGEAKDGGKPLATHATHLVVHGVLHLLGYDHERDREAREMEALEIRILAELGIANPYAAHSAA